MDGKNIYIVFDNCYTEFNDIIGIFETKDEAETYAIEISRKWFDDIKIAPEDRIVSTDENGNIYEIYDDRYNVYTYIREYPLNYKGY